jgi:hypothetical protein
VANYLDDITHLYDELKMGNEGKLASKTVSFIEWTNAMTSTDFSDERDFWNNMETIQVKSLASQNVNKKISSVKRLQVDLGKTLSIKFILIVVRNKMWKTNLYLPYS